MNLFNQLTLCYSPVYHPVNMSTMLLYPCQFICAFTWHLYWHIMLLFSIVLMPIIQYFIFSDPYLMEIVCTMKNEKWVLFSGGFVPLIASAIKITNIKDWENKLLYCFWKNKSINIILSSTEDSIQQSQWNFKNKLIILKTNSFTKVIPLQNYRNLMYSPANSNKLIIDTDNCHKFGDIYNLWLLLCLFFWH